MRITIRLPLWLLGLALLLVAVVVALPVALIVHLSHPASVGVATFHPTGGYAFNEGETVTLALPADWESVYNGHQPFREATILDGRGEPQLEVTVDLLDFSEWGPAVHSIEEAARAAAERRRAKGWSSSVQRTTSAPRGPMWQVTNTRGPEPIFLAGRGREPAQALHLQFLEPWRGKVLEFTFRLRADREGTLEPLVWRVVQNARLSLR